VIASSLRVHGAGVELAVTCVGDPSQPTVLLVHGYPDTREVWCDVVPILAGRFHVVAYDVRGAGESTAPPDLAGFDLERLCDDVLAVVDATCLDRPVHLVGHDWGSIQGWEFVTSAPLRGRFASFTSISGPCLDHVGIWLAEGLRRPSPKKLVAMAGQLRRSWYIAAFQAPGLAEVTWRSSLPRHWPAVMREFEGVPEGHAGLSDTIARDGALGVGLYRRNVLRRLRRPRLDAVTSIPVQLIVPTRDRYVSPRLLDDVGRWAPSLRRRSIHSGHWVPRTRPRELAGWIAEHVLDVEEGRLGVHPSQVGDTTGARPAGGAITKPSRIG
jgi:pimeloyl-ACP methyl ester carboxylesterase